MITDLMMMYFILILSIVMAICFTVSIIFIVKFEARTQEIRREAQIIANNNHKK